MADEVRIWTDKKLSKMENRLTSIYQKSAKGIYKTWDNFMAKAAEETSDLQKAYEDAKKSGDKSLIKKTGKKLSTYKKEVTLQNEQYQEMLEGVTGRIATVNQTALACINNQLPSIYGANYNGIKTDADNLGFKFNLVNESTVKRLVLDGDIQLPYKKLDVIKDKRWNTKQLNSAVLQGILQGESMDKIAERIKPIVNNNENAAIRNARTMVTGAENRGRLDSYKALEDEGAVLSKVWIATADGRTREWHLSMDGQEVDVNDVFIDGNGNELEYPGDPDGAPESVYNCRCSMATHITGIKQVDGSIKNIDYESESTLHDEQIEKEKKKRI